RGHHVAGQIVEGGRVPIARRSADASFVVAEDGHAVADQESRPWQHVFPILGAGAMYENDRGMSGYFGWTDERPGQLNVAAREADVFAFLDLDESRRARSGPFAPPHERDDLAGAVALKFDTGLDCGRQRHAGTGKKLVAVGRIQR